jgi:hypothetical protein
MAREKSYGAPGKRESMMKQERDGQYVQTFINGAKVSGSFEHPQAVAYCLKDERLVVFVQEGNKWFELLSAR